MEIKNKVIDKKEKDKKKKKSKKDKKRFEDEDEFAFTVIKMDDVLTQALDDLNRNPEFINLANKNLQELGILRKIPADNQRTIKYVDLTHNMLSNIDSLSEFENMRQINAS